MGIELNNEQIYTVYDLEHWWHRSTKQTYEISGAAGTGKCQPIDTIIPTPNGEMKLGDLKVGDYVFNRHGEPVKILGVYDQGKKHAYRVTLDDGRSTICNDEHLWSYITSKGNLKTVTLREMMNKGLINDEYRGHRFAIPQSKTTQYTKKEFKIDPYVIGVFLGNGCCTLENLTLSSNDIETVNNIVKLTGSIDYCKPSDYNYNYEFYLNDEQKNQYINEFNFNSSIKKHKTKIFFNNFPEICTDSHHKRIPKEYFYGDEEQRWSLIQGLFDTDGCIHDDFRGNVEYTGVSINLIQDIKYILASLGCSSTIHSSIRIDKGESYICYSLYVKVQNNIKEKFFRLKRKKDIAIKLAKTRIRKHNYYQNYIYDVEDLGYETEMRCIYVDDPEHLYLTNDFIVTHNTTLIRYFIERLGLKHDNVLFVAFMGKAASQMARNGLPAKTIHSAIYEYKEKMARDEDGRIILKSNGKPKLISYFSLKDHISKKIKLIVVDEASMVDEKMALDLLSFNIPVIALGDLNQLPPVFGNSYFLRNPDTILKQIMRQAEGDPIVWISQQILSGNTLRYGVYGNSSIIPKKDISEYHFRKSDIILTGTNRLRYNINQYCREEIKGIKKLEYPHIGEKVICRKNNWSQCIDENIYLTNGTTGFVENVYRDSYNTRTMKIDFRPDFSKKSFKNIEFDYNHMYAIPGQEDDTNKFGYFYDKMEFAYAITCHASQGSQWPTVMYLHEDFMRDPEDSKRLIYTAVTRASQSIIFVM